MTAERMLGQKFMISALAFLAVIAQTVSAQPNVIINGGSPDEVRVQTDDTVVHHASGFLFANHIGDMPLRKVQIYGPGDVSVDYSLRGGGNGDAWITLFVYPARKELAGEAIDIESAIVDRIHGVRIASPGSVPQAAADGRSAWYAGSLDQMRLTSGYVIVRRGGWFIEARASVPSQAGQEGISRTMNALAAIQWNWRPAPPATPPTT